MSLNNFDLSDDDEKRSPSSFAVTEQPSYYDLMSKTNVMLEVQQIALVFSIVLVFLYGSYDLNHAFGVMVQNGLSSCTAQRLLLPTPHLLASAFLLAYFFYRASNYRPGPTDWRNFIAYINHEDEFKDFFAGKVVKRKGKLFIVKFGALLFAIVMPFVLVHLYGYFYGECRKFSEHINDRINFFESILILTFPTYLFVLFVVFILREREKTQRYRS